MDEIKEWSHWLLLILVVGTLAMIFLNRPDQTEKLMKAGTGAFADISGTLKTFSAA